MLKAVSRYIFYWGIFLTGAAAILMSACLSGDKSGLTELPLTLARRSVLDQQVRMLSLRFGADRFAAYQLDSSGGLKKIWRGGILWNGAAFNNLKTVQPESYGSVYWENPEKNDSWTLEQNGKREKLELDFLAYTLEDQGIRLTYSVKGYPGLQVMERPTFKEDSGNPVFQQNIRVKGLPPNSMIYYDNVPISENKGTTIDKKIEPIPPVLAPDPDISNNNSQYWLERSGCNTCHDRSGKKIGPSYEAIAANYPDDKKTADQLALNVRNGNSGNWGPVAMTPHPDLELADIRRMVSYILSLRPEGEEQRQVQIRNAEEDVHQPPSLPGFGAPLDQIHPAYDLITVRPAWFKPRVGGMAFLPDGKLLLSTWDSVGSVYSLEGLESNDTNRISIKQIASGLSEPLGLTTAGSDIFVLQKHELTQLIDKNGDGLTNEYRSVNHSFGATPDFHEFSYGLVYRDGFFYGALGLAMRLMAHELQLQDRGTVFRAGIDGSFEIMARGLRQPNGIGFGPQGDLFVLENQGQWVPACKLVHVQQDGFYGCRFGMGDRLMDRKALPPAVWLPQDEIGNSPSQPLIMQDGPYKDQLIYGEVTNGGIKRIFLEKVNGRYQGCVFRFIQGLEAGINRMAWGPDGGLYVGGVGMNGNWTHQGKQFGLQKLIFNGNIPFEILSVRAQPGGFELEFTKPLPENLTNILEKITIRQWYYEATPAYGGPKLDLQTLAARTGTLNADRTALSLQIPGLKRGYVVHFSLAPDLVSATGEQLWNGDVWYTLNHIPLVQ